MKATAKVRILVVDDHPIVRDGLLSSLQTIAGVNLVAACANGEDALRRLRSDSVDVVLADVRMAPMSGIDLLKKIREHHPDVHVLMFSSYDTEEEIFQAYALGAAGYLNKGISSQEIAAAIFDVAAGKRLFSKQDLIFINDRRQRRELTQREMEILQMLAKGLTNREIGEVFSISHLTVRNLSRRVFAKLEASDRTEATRIAIQRGIIVLD